MRKASLAIAALSAGLAALPASASAQAWIGMMVAQMSNEQAAAVAEANCRKGVPASAKTLAWASRTSDATLAAYLHLGPQSKPSAVNKVFAAGRPGLAWKGPNGMVPLEQLPAHLDGKPPVLERMAFVVAGDGTSARGIWKATWPAQPERTGWYAVDLVGSPQGTIWGGGAYRIWHFTEIAGTQPPTEPAAYCHYDPDQAW